MLLSYFLWVRRQLPCVVTTGCSHGCSGLKSYCENNSSNSNNNNNNNNNQKQQQQSTGRIIAATKSYPGSENDKTIIVRDKSIWRIQNEEPWKSYKCSLYNTDGSATDYKGAWLVVDGGYPKVKA